MADVYKDFQREPSRAHQCVHESEKDGTRCRAMAMQNNYMCYAHRTDDVPTVIENDMFLIDNLDTHEAIQKSFCDVAARLACNHIDLKRAELLITLLRAASRNLRDAATARRQALREAAAEAAPEPARTSPRAPKRVYTDEEKDFLKSTTSSTHYAPVDSPRPESITDDDIIAAINAKRRDCSLGPVDTDPNWNRATLSADPVSRYPEASASGLPASAKPITLPTLQAVAAPTYHTTDYSPLLPNILVPHLGMLRNKPRQQRPASLRLQVHHLDPILPQPRHSTLKRHTLPHNQPLEPELPHQPRAVPARRQSRHHGAPAIAPLPPRPPERIRLAMRARIALLHPPVVSGAQQPPG